MQKYCQRSFDVATISSAFRSVQFYISIVRKTLFTNIRGREIVFTSDRETDRSNKGDFL